MLVKTAAVLLTCAVICNIFFGTNSSVFEIAKCCCEIQINVSEFERLAASKR